LNDTGIPVAFAVSAFENLIQAVLIIFMVIVQGDLGAPGSITSRGANPYIMPLSSSYTPNRTKPENELKKSLQWNQRTHARAFFT